MENQPFIFIVIIPNNCARICLLYQAETIVFLSLSYKSLGLIHSPGKCISIINFIKAITILGNKENQRIDERKKTIVTERMFLRSLQDFLSSIITNDYSILEATFALDILVDGNDLVLGEASFQFCPGAHLHRENVLDCNTCLL